MTAPYTVLIDHYGDHQSFDCATFRVALTVAKLANRDYPGRVHVLGDVHDAEFFTDGSVKANDGLTPDERERVAEALEC